MVPQWIKQAEQEQYCTMLGDDIDSLTSASVLNKVFGWEINWFYDFNNIYTYDPDNKKERVGADMALEQGKTIDNHTVLLKPTDYINEESVNMNTMFKVSRERYTDKYAMSTLLTLWSLLGLELPDTEEGIKILLCIDSSYKGFFNDKFKPVHKEWLRKLGFEKLTEFLKNDTSYKELDMTIKKRYGLYNKIYCDKNGQLKNTGIDLRAVGKLLGLDLELPKGKLELVQELHSGHINIKDFQKNNKGNPLVKSEDVFSFALTYRDSASFTMF